MWRLRFLINVHCHEPFHLQILCNLKSSVCYRPLDRIDPVMGRDLISYLWQAIKACLRKESLVYGCSIMTMFTQASFYKSPATSGLSSLDFKALSLHNNSSSSTLATASASSSSSTLSQASLQWGSEASRQAYGDLSSLATTAPTVRTGMSVTQQQLPQAESSENDWGFFVDDSF
jgi:hypothetical protein